MAASPARKGCQGKRVFSSTHPLMVSPLYREGAAGRARLA
jgi:hypothetical protein